MVLKMKHEHPWVWLGLALESNDMTQKQFADLIGKSPVEVNQIISWKRAVTLDWAMKICAVFWWEPKYWLEMQADYDEQEYRNSNKYPKILEIQKKAKKLTLA